MLLRDRHRWDLFCGPCTHAFFGLSLFICEFRHRFPFLLRNSSLLVLLKLLTWPLHSSELEFLSLAYDFLCFIFQNCLVFFAPQTWAQSMEYTRIRSLTNRNAIEITLKPIGEMERTKKNAQWNNDETNAFKLFVTFSSLLLIYRFFICLRCIEIFKHKYRFQADHFSQRALHNSLSCDEQTAIKNAQTK